ncbi:MAG: transglutaminase family protein [Limimaricola sp.]|nr:transglutaminase family protein [Limimaricola sp.]
MRFRIGCRLGYEFPQPTPMIAMLNVHYSRFADLEQPDHLTTDPAVTIQSYRDGFGNWCSRLVAPAGPMVLTTSGVIRDDGAPDPVRPEARQHAVEDLPAETLSCLLGSRYCDTDVLSDRAWQLFEGTAPGWPRVQAICDYVHNHIAFGYEFARSTRTASEALAEARGVCRDYTHLAIAFCRCMNIPARYCTGYISDVGTPQPWAPGDFAAWMEVYLDNAWWVFDPRNNEPRIGRVLIARGRDAADVPLTHTFGPNVMTGFQVWMDQIED